MRRTLAGVLILLLGACPDVTIIHEGDECCEGCEPEPGESDSGPEPDMDGGTPDATVADADVPDANRADANCDEDQEIVPFECVCDNEFCGGPPACHPCNIPYPDGSVEIDAMTEDSDAGE